VLNKNGRRPEIYKFVPKWVVNFQAKKFKNAKISKKFKIYPKKYIPPI
jgi:hypothetical protein